MTIIYDSHEQEGHRFRFPETMRIHRDRECKGSLLFIKPVKEMLWAGDYTESTRTVGIEKKGSLRECYHNILTADYGRFTAALDKLVEAYRYRYLVFDGGVSDLHAASIPEGPQIVDCLLDECLKRGITPMWIGRSMVTSGRRHIGEFLVRLMLRHLLAK